MYDMMLNNISNRERNEGGRWKEGNKKEKQRRKKGKEEKEKGGLQAMIHVFEILFLKL